MSEPPPELVALAVGDPPEPWRAAGFTVADGPAVRLAGIRLDLEGRARGDGVLGWSWRGLGPEPLDGLATAVEEEPAAPADEHPNGAVALDHVVVATPDVERTTAAFAARGLDPRRTRSAEVGGSPVRQVFFRAGATVVEVVGPADAAGEGPARFFGLALTVRDLDAARDRLGESLGRSKDAVQPGRRIATLRHRDLGVSVAVALMSPRP